MQIYQLNLEFGTASSQQLSRVRIYISEVESAAEPVIIFASGGEESFDDSGRILAMNGNLVAIVALAGMPWEFSVSELLELFDRLLEVAELRGRRPVLYGLGLDGVMALLLALHLPADSLSGLALGCMAPTLSESWLCHNGVLTGSGLREVLMRCGVSVTPALLSSLHNWQAGNSPLTPCPQLEGWLLELCRQDGAFFRRRHELDFTDVARRLPMLPVLLLDSWRHASAGGLLQFSWRLAQRSDLPLEVRFTGEPLEFPRYYAADSPATVIFAQWLKNLHLSGKAHNYHYFMWEAEGFAGQWCSCQQWPVVGLSNHLFHLHAGSLLPAVPTDHTAPSTTMVVEQEHLTPLQGNLQDFGLRPDLTEDGIPASFCHGTAVFTAVPMGEELTLLGLPRVNLWYTGNRSDAALTVRLTAVLPRNPVPLTLATGICRLALRNDPQMPMLNDAVELPVALNFSLTPTCCRLPAGTRLRLEITGCETPRFLPILSVEPTTPQRFRNTIWHTPRYPSRLILPVLNKASPMPAPAGRT